MIRYSFAVAAIFFSTFLFAQDDIAKSSWISSAIKIDGNPQEWKLPLRYYDAGTKLFFAIANDDKNLYVCLQAPDEMGQVKIMHAGMEIYLSVKGKHKVSVTFPLANQSSAVSSQSDNNNQAFNRKEKRTSFILQNTMMEVKGFEKRNGIIPINDSSGINAAINWDENDKLTYEAAIPLKEWLGEDYNNAGISNDISLEIEIKAIRRKAHPGSGDSESGFSGGGKGGRMGGGGMHHERSATTDEENSVLPGENKWSMYEKSKLKEKFILAKPGDVK